MDAIKSMGPFLVTSQAFGLFPYHLKKSTNGSIIKKSHHLVFYSKLLFWLSFLIEPVLQFTNKGKIPFRVQNEIFSKLVLFLSSFTITANFCLIMGTIIVQKKSWCLWLNKFNNVCMSPGEKAGSRILPVLNRRLFLFSCLHFAMIVLLCFRFEMSTGLILTETTFYIKLWITHLFLKNFVVLANSIRCFYQVERENLKSKKLPGCRGIWVKYLQELRKKDLLVNDFADALQSYYGPALGVQLLWHFVTLLCDITLTRKAGMPTRMQIAWMVYICLEIVTLTGAGHLAVKEPGKALSFIQEFFIDLNDSDILYEIEILSLQFQHRKIEFNIFGILRVDFTLLYSMIGVTTTYTVILLQFQNNYQESIEDMAAGNKSTGVIL